MPSNRILYRYNFYIYLYLSRLSQICLTMTNMEQELERLRAENDALRERASKKLRFKIGEKGGLSVSGLSQRFPVTLYKQDWKFLLEPENVARILNYIDDHEDELK